MPKFAWSNHRHTLLKLPEWLTNLYTRCGNVILILWHKLRTEQANQSPRSRLLWRDEHHKHLIKAILRPLRAWASARAATTNSSANRICAYNYRFLVLHELSPPFKIDCFISWRDISKQSPPHIHSNGLYESDLENLAFPRFNFRFPHWLVIVYHNNATVGWNLFIRNLPSSPASINLDASISMHQNTHEATTW